MRHENLLNQSDTVFAVIDMQDKFEVQIPNWDDIHDNIKQLIWVCNKLNIPVISTVHYPKGLGHVAEGIVEELADKEIIDKITFSCCGEENFNEKLKTYNRKKIVLSGIETHICILQTALDLIQSGYEVYLVSDATGSRHKDDYITAIERMTVHKVSIITKEMMIFELLYRADTDDFKEIQKYIFKKPKIGFLK